MNALIPLGIEMPNFGAQYAAGQQARYAQDEAQSKNALRAALQQYGAAASQGDQNALRELAKFDPTMVSQLNNDTQQRAASQQSVEASKAGMANDADQLAILRQTAAESSAEHVALMDEKQLAKADKIASDIAAAASTFETEDEWKAYFGRPDASPREKEMAGKWGQRKQIEAQALGLKDSIAARTPEPSASRAGKIGDDLRAGRITQEQADAELAKGEGVTVNNNLGGQQQAAAEQTAQSADIVGQDIQRARDASKDAWLPTTGLVGGFLSSIGGTGAHDVASLLDTIKANISFDKLQAMKAASKTGGALGAVSDTEIKLLQSTLGSLEQSQSHEQFIANLDRLATQYKGIKDKADAATGAQGGSAAAPAGGQRKTKSGIVWEPAGPR